MPYQNINVIAGPPVREHPAAGRPGTGVHPYATAAATPLCQTEPDLYFSEDPGDLRLAKALCRQCPLLDAGITGALERGERWGFWGGELFQNGRIIPDKRPRGRPRKAAVAA
jgi:WhiB family transcriptional regulator, redox-sensing transcriptional regulator